MSHNGFVGFILLSLKGCFAWNTTQNSPRIKGHLGFPNPDTKKCYTTNQLTGLSSVLFSLVFSCTSIGHLCKARCGFQSIKF